MLVIHRCVCIFQYSISYYYYTCYTLILLPYYIIMIRLNNIATSQSMHTWCMMCIACRLTAYWASRFLCHIYTIAPNAYFICNMLHVHIMHVYLLYMPSTFPYMCAVDRAMVSVCILQHANKPVCTQIFKWTSCCWRKEWRAILSDKLSWQNHANKCSDFCSELTLIMQRSVINNILLSNHKKLINVINCQFMRKLFNNMMVAFGAIICIYEYFYHKAKIVVATQTLSLLQERNPSVSSIWYTSIFILLEILNPNIHFNDILRTEWKFVGKKMFFFFQNRTN